MATFRKSRAAEARPAAAVLAGVLALLAADPARAQETHAAGNPETTAAQRAEADTPAEPKDRRTMSSFGTKLSTTEAAALLREMRQLTEQALAASRGAEQGAGVADVKAAAGQVLTAVWGIPAGVSGEGAAEVAVPGWKERWQVTGAEFDPAFVKRYGSAAPRVTDPRGLGIQGRGMAVRGRLEQLIGPASDQPMATGTPAQRLLVSLNNVIGWTHISRGYKGREVQPRPSLTYVWDAPPEFWNSSADTGWLHEVYAQASNILKTDYAGDVAEARKHATGMTELLQRVLNGIDADKNGTVEAKPMEGGLAAALAEADRALQVQTSSQ